MMPPVKLDHVSPPRFPTASLDDTVLRAPRAAENDALDLAGPLTRRKLLLRAPKDGKAVPAVVLPEPTTSHGLRLPLSDSQYTTAFRQARAAVDAGALRSAEFSFNSLLRTVQGEDDYRLAGDYGMLMRELSVLQEAQGAVGKIYAEKTPFTLEVVSERLHNLFGMVDGMKRYLAFVDRPEVAAQIERRNPEIPNLIATARLDAAENIVAAGNTAARFILDIAQSANARATWPSISEGLRRGDFGPLNPDPDVAMLQCAEALQGTAGAPQINPQIAFSLLMHHQHARSPHAEALRGDVLFDTNPAIVVSSWMSWSMVALARLGAAIGDVRSRLGDILPVGHEDLTILDRQLEQARTFQTPAE
jgi:hypothetical protein